MPFKRVLLFWLYAVTSLDLKDNPLLRSNQGSKKATKSSQHTQSVTEIQPYQVSSLKLPFSPVFLDSSILLCFFFNFCFVAYLEIGTSVTFTPSLPVMLTAQVIDKEWKQMHLHG